MKIKEIFSSIQGEGPFVGYKQLFIRFCGCNLDCSYCDTEFGIDNSTEYSLGELATICQKNKDCHSISLTGGEPLIHTDFLKEFLPIVNMPVYLETNATLYKELEEIIEFIAYVSADIKLPSCTGLSPLFEKHDKFFEIASRKTLFAKIVFDENITEEEIKECCKLGRKYNIELILQPLMKGDVLGIPSEILLTILEKFLKNYKNVRLIPQVHKFISCK